ncbi:MAG: hypothetical protein WAV54_11340 [Acidimicrobiales bacterium]
MATTRKGLGELAVLLSDAAVTTVAMEATGVYWRLAMSPRRRGEEAERVAVEAGEPTSEVLAAFVEQQELLDAALFPVLCRTNTKANRSA